MSQLTKTELRWASATLTTIYPAYEGAPAIDGMRLDAYLNDVCAHSPFKAFLGLRAVLLLVAIAPLFILGRFATIAGLGLPERELVVTRLLASRLYAVRQLLMMLKAMGAMLYAAHPAVRARMLKPRVEKPRLIALRAKRPQAA